MGKRKENKMEKSIQVNEKDYENIRVKCEKCQGQFLMFVHRNIKTNTCVLGCGHCGHPNKIKLGE